MIASAALAPANASDRALAPELVAGQHGWALGDGAYWSPALSSELADAGVTLVAPPPRKLAPDGRWPRWLVQTRRRVETVLGQLAERYHAKRVWARDPWHVSARWLRKIVSHTMAVVLCQRTGVAPLSFARLLTC